MTLKLDSLRALSRSIVERQGLRVEDVQVMSAEGGTDRFELLITIAGCHRDPCSLLLNLTRVDQADLEQELATKLRAAVAAHVPRANAD
jgi:hypothetical protein